MYKYIKKIIVMLMLLNIFSCISIEILQDLRDENVRAANRGYLNRKFEYVVDGKPVIMTIRLNEFEAFIDIDGKGEKRFKRDSKYKADYKYKNGDDLLVFKKETFEYGENNFNRFEFNGKILKEIIEEENRILQYTLHYQKTNLKYNSLSIARYLNKIDLFFYIDPIYFNIPLVSVDGDISVYKRDGIRVEIQERGDVNLYIYGDKLVYDNKPILKNKIYKFYPIISTYGMKEVTLDVYTRKIDVFFDGKYETTLKKYGANGADKGKGRITDLYLEFENKDLLLELKRIFFDDSDVYYFLENPIKYEEYELFNKDNKSSNVKVKFNENEYIIEKDGHMLNGIFLEGYNIYKSEDGKITVKNAYITKDYQEVEIDINGRKSIYVNKMDKPNIPELTKEELKKIDLEYNKPIIVNNARYHFYTDGNIQAYFWVKNGVALIGFNGLHLRLYPDKNNIYVNENYGNDTYLKIYKTHLLLTVSGKEYKLKKIYTSKK